MPFAAAASTVASLSTATVTRPRQSAIARSRAGSTDSLASRRSSPSPARAMPTISRGVAAVKWVCPRRACSRASAVHLCALTCGRSRAPGSAARHRVEVVRAARCVSTTSAGVERSATVGHAWEHGTTCRLLPKNGRRPSATGTPTSCRRLPQRDYLIPATRWVEAPAALRDARRRSRRRSRRVQAPDPQLPAVAGGAGGARRRACTWRSTTRDLERRFTYRLFPDGSGEGIGPDGAVHTRFRTWKEALRDDPPDDPDA